MRAWLKSWKGGLLVAAACSVIGLVRLAGAPLDGRTWLFFPLAAGYAVAAVIGRRVQNASRTRAADPARWTTQPSRAVAWFAAQRGRARHPDQVALPAGIDLAPSTKDRVGALLAIAAAIVGLVLVFHDHAGDDRQTPAGPPFPASQGPADGSRLWESPPGQVPHQPA